MHRNYLALNDPNKIINDGGHGAMGEPWGIAFGKDGMWAVADHSNHCVYIFDSQDQVVRKIGSKGKGNGEFDKPLGLAFDADNNLYVVCRYIYIYIITGYRSLLLMGNSYSSSVIWEQPMVNLTVH